MGKVTGIDIGSSHIHMVEVDGSARRHKISKFISFPRSSGGLVEGEEADSVKKSLLIDDLAQAFEESGIGKMQALLALSSSHCVLRNITLPFKGKDVISKVVKFEAESYIHSHSIDDVIVDSCTVEERDKVTELFLAAYPKALLSESLKALNKIGVDPQVCDLDACLLVGAASALGLLSSSTNGPDSTEGSNKSPNLILDIGYASTQITLVDGARILTSRSVRWGLDRCERKLADELQVDPREVHEALDRHFGLARPRETVLAAGGEAAASENESENENSDPAIVATELDSNVIPDDSELVLDFEASSLSIGLAELSDASRALAASLFREIVRFLSGQKMSGDLGRIFVSGGGSRWPGFIEAMSRESGVSVETLDLLAEIEIEPALELPAPELNLAYAAAMTGLGASTSSMNFRQEELVFKRKFDQLKFPLALFTLLLAILLFFMNLILYRGIQRVEWSIGVETKAAIRGAKVSPGKKARTVQVWTGLLHDLATANRRSGRIMKVLGKRRHSEYQKRIRATEPMDRLVETRNYLARIKKKLEKETGFHSELKLESGLAVLQAFSVAIDKADRDPRMEDFIITQMNMVVGTKKNRSLTFTIAMAGERFREQKGVFAQIMKSCCGGDGPFESVKDSSEVQITNSIYRATYLFTFTLKKSIDVFQPER